MGESLQTNLLTSLIKLDLGGVIYKNNQFKLCSGPASFYKGDIFTKKAS